MAETPAPLFRRLRPQPPSSALPSSSPAFGTPVHPPKPFNAPTTKAAILPIILPPATLRPLAFRTFTKKHSLTLTSSALQELASFIGRHCGSGWREEGLAERVLEEVARSWKNRNGGVIVDGASKQLLDILKTLAGNMVGGKVIGPGRGLPRGDSMLDVRDSDDVTTRQGLRPTMMTTLARGDRSASFGMSGLGVQEEADEDEEGSSSNDPRAWLKVIDAYEQPRLFFNVAKKHFERETTKPSLFPPASHKTTAFRNRYNVIHQRLLRNEAFQTSTVLSSRPRNTTNNPLDRQSLRITPIANMLGRHGSGHMLLGLLVELPTGELAVSDLTGTIAVDLSRAVAIPHDSAWFCPGMVVLVDGVYEEADDAVGKGLGGSGGGSGVGGTLGGYFQAFFIGQPPCEKRKATLGLTGPDGGGESGGGGDHTIGGGFGWIDFLGVGSERAVGAKMRRLERRLLPPQPQIRPQPQPQQSKTPAAPASSALPSSPPSETAPPPQPPPALPVSLDSSSTPPLTRGRLIILGELNLDLPRTLHALRRILTLYASEPEGTCPLAFILTGNFAQHAVMARGGTGSSSSSSGSGSGTGIEYKESFDALASTLADFPTLLQAATFVFVPGDNDGWESAFGAGAAVPLPRRGVPDMFTSRVRRAFAAANSDVAGGGGGAGGIGGGASRRHRGVPGTAVWTSNPSRLALFGPSHEIVIFRDDLAARLRRVSIVLPRQPQQDTTTTDTNSQTHQSTEDLMDLDTETSPNPPPTSPNAKQPPTSTSQDTLTAQKLVKTILDQGNLSPFRTAIRPVHWDLAGSLALYPLPSALVLVDPTAPPFCLTYEGCHVVNPGALLSNGTAMAGMGAGGGGGSSGVARWVEYDVGRGGTLRECSF